MANPWNEETPFDLSELWVACEPITSSMGRKISGDPNTPWEEYVYRTYMSAHDEASRCLIVGSGDGRTARILCGFGFRGEIVASDVAENALRRSAEEAAALGYQNIRHVRADLNEDAFVDDFDYIIADGVLHHIERLEHCLTMLHDRLKPNGVLMGPEYVGPFRFQLPEAQVAWINAFLTMFPPGMKRHGEPYAPPSLELMLAFDPTEAVSGESLRALLPRVFNVIENKLLGGTLTTYIHECVDYRKANEPPYRRWMELAVSLEDTLIREGVIQSDYAFYVATKR